ncbi:MAG: PEP-CTERM sorting domain-containing protein [Microcystis aeruginosa Ma_QC_Ch_20071001_S25]|uniref:PEP-CTERM sorting domain-containing protein n=1 Tax=Microcystis aeruginosa Ma_QC_Ch_20071001_S25D TaxID=2486250 RepID=A0A552FM57_MICAE|nr:MAG: PEP-CTERM sorting domain-containing protein [Microcystis aeruginosa Ma_QC_Ch_20071001_S25D]TRU51430.1 MAG: PEP-CTERM sorting domain-containing protein [Microcystis aeruginosa Ma_QC_Ch_20071001_S25]TRU59915.1 MAG: PEP-CTERM sorting domain-containing protein [Microcystis aeruginosa Ma_QC_Ch_20071001_M135]
MFQNGLFSVTVNILGFNDFFVPNLVDLTGFSNVSSIRIYNVTDPAGLGWDNFQFDVATNPVSTPEPTSTLSLLALGTLGTASTLKRKLKSSKLTEKETTKVS